MDWNILIPLVLFFFLWGGIPTGYLIALKKGIDIRRHGSGNIGATNIMRTLGIRWGVIVALLDIIKAAVPLVSVWYVFDAQAELVFLYTAISLMFGNVFSPYLGFRGGKGIGTLGGIVLAYDVFFFLIVLMIWGGALIGVRVMSLINIVIVLGVMPVLWFFFSYTYWYVIAFFTAICIIYSHRSNIMRVIHRTEKRLW